MLSAMTHFCYSRRPREAHGGKAHQMRMYRRHQWTLRHLLSRRNRIKKQSKHRRKRPSHSRQQSFRHRNLLRNCRKRICSLKNKWAQWLCHLFLVQRWMRRKVWPNQMACSSSSELTSGRYWTTLLHKSWMSGHRELRWRNVHNKR